METIGGSSGTIILRTISDAYLNRIPILNEAGEISVHSHIDRHVTTANGRIRGVYNPTNNRRTKHDTVAVKWRKTDEGRRWRVTRARGGLKMLKKEKALPERWRGEPGPRGFSDLFFLK